PFPAGRTPLRLRRCARRSPAGGPCPHAGGVRARTDTRGRSGGRSRALFLDVEEARDDVGGLLPVGLLTRKLLSAGLRQAVDLHAAPAVGRAPLCRNPARLFEPKQRRIERALVERERVAADLLDAAREPVTVQRPERLECLEHHEAEAAVENVLLRGCHRWPDYMSNRLTVNMISRVAVSPSKPGGSGMEGTF